MQVYGCGVVRKRDGVKVKFVDIVKQCKSTAVAWSELLVIEERVCWEHNEGLAGLCAAAGRGTAGGMGVASFWWCFHTWPSTEVATWVFAVYG
eukprot:s5592_g1.t1